ncbi:transketolase family protein [Paracoccus sp. P2]|uniref:Transketolase family protein n=1 Tax=Paracoccus pantotrophus TaxID=82367 RepID=A0A7H9BPQ3_PARPN|nr:transketolase family protein [Paracoccus pantotrophus]MDF3856345.1 transketolase family protein [Paracoccus pantotrophus]QLH12755.1 transketolase family protein [Paracoccus pantotrophus]RDD96403.1 transketolase family protein [Paracoccus pantotrophus]RNI17924.1 transketolase family protein [Paracoccus pantotrophus]WGR66367.1 transketolase family protein [Paracoccus pantotrophus]
MTLASMKRKYEPRKLPEGPRVATTAMIASLAAEGYDTVAAPFGHALVEAAQKDDKIVGLSADLAKYTDLHIFAQAMPDRFYQMGMAEQLLMSAAAGLAREGFNPFATTYAVFASRRAYDFIAMAIAEENLPVKIVCALPGLTTGYGPSHQATEDLAIFRGLPNMTVIDPCDADDIIGMVPQIVAHDGPVYSRLPRGKVPTVLTRHKPDYRFQLGKAQVIREGKDVLIVSTGFMTMRALDAAEALARDGVDAAVLHVPTIKPLDTETILAEARKGGRLVVTAENHTVVGGLGEAVAATLLRNGVTPAFRMIGLPDQFLEAGALPTLHEMYGLTVGKITERIKGWL